MTGEPSPPTHKTPEELIALLMAGLLTLVSSLIDATLLPGTHRDRLHAAFAQLFARLEAQLIAMVQQQIALTALKQAKAITTLAAPIPTSAPEPASAPTKTSPHAAEAPHPKRAPAPHHPTRAPHRAVAPSTRPALPNLRKFQNAAVTAAPSHVHFVTIS